MPQPFAVPNDPRTKHINAAIRQLVKIRSKLERSMAVVAVKSSFLESDPEYVEAIKKENFNKKYLKYLNDQITNLELTT